MKEDEDIVRSLRARIKEKKVGLMNYWSGDSSWVHNPSIPFMEGQLGREPEFPLVQDPRGPSRSPSNLRHDTNHCNMTRSVCYDGVWMVIDQTG